MKKIIALLMTLVLLSLTACTNAEPAATAATTQPTEPVEQVTVENPLKSLYLSLNTENGEYFYLNAFDDGTGGVQVEMQADVRKVATMEAWVLHGITKALSESGLEALNGKNMTADGMAGCSVFGEYADGSILGASTTGQLTAEFTDGYAAMEEYFRRLLQATPVYVPQPMVQGDVDEAQKQEILTVLNGSGIDALDGFVLSAVAKDAFMGHTLGMRDTTHVVSATNCSHMIQPYAYSLVIVQVDDSANIDAVRKDLAENLNWAKWVCVTASDAVIAQKGDLVLCLMGGGDAFEGTKQSIENAGWEAIQAYEDK